VMLEPDLEVLDRGRIVTKFLEGCVDAPGWPVIVNRRIETGGVESSDVIEADPGAAFFFDGSQPGCAVGQVAYKEGQIKAPFVIGGAFLQDTFFHSCLKGVISEYRDVAPVADGIDLCFQPDMGPFVPEFGVADVFRAIIIGIREPKRPQDNEGGVGRRGPRIVAIQEVRDLIAGGLVKNELAVIITSKIRDAGVDADTPRVGSFVDDFKMAETGGRSRVFGRIRDSAEPDGDSVQGGQRRRRLRTSGQSQEEQGGQ